MIGYFMAMTIVTYLKQNWRNVSLLILGVITVLCVFVMAVGLHRGGRLKELPFSLLESKPLPEVLPRNIYEDYVTRLKGPYLSKLTHKRNIFSRYEIASKDKPVSSVTEFRTVSDWLKVAKIYRKPVQLLFKGYMQLPDNTFVVTINWSGKTDFLKIGEVVRGYKIMDFKKDVTEEKAQWGGTQKVDKTIITLERTTGERFILPIGKITLEKEIFAELRDLREKKNYEVHIESEILQYKVLDINPAEVIISDPKGEKFCLKK